MNKKRTLNSCADGSRETNGKVLLACKLTSSALRERKATIIHGLKNKVLSRKELKNGFVYQFQVSDAMTDELTEFIKTERACCGFLVFNLLLSGHTSKISLKITGPPGAKDFIQTELEM